MDADDLELFERSIAARRRRGRPAPRSTTRSHDLGWLDALADDDPAAVSILFEHQGRRHATCAALDHLLARALSGGAAAGADRRGGPPGPRQRPTRPAASTATGSSSRGLATVASSASEATALVADRPSTTGSIGVEVARPRR